MGKQNRTFIVILSPVVQIPAELEKQFVVIEHELPGREQLTEIARGIATEQGELPADLELERVLDAAAGLTRYEAEGAFSLSLVRHGKLRADVALGTEVPDAKEKWPAVAAPGQRVGLRTWAASRASRRSACGLCAARPTPIPQVRPRGVLLLSPPGCGKSHSARRSETRPGRPTLMLDVGSLLGSLVGQSEANIRQALRIIDAMAPAVCCP